MIESKRTTSTQRRASSSARFVLVVQQYILLYVVISFSTFGRMDVVSTDSSSKLTADKLEDYHIQQLQYIVPVCSSVGKRSGGQYCLYHTTIKLRPGGVSSSGLGRFLGKFSSTTAPRGDRQMQKKIPATNVQHHRYASI